MTSVCHHSKREAKPNSVYRRAITVLLAAVLAVGAVLFCVRGGVSAKYVSEFRQAVTLIIDPTKPIFASGSGWYRGTADKAAITAVTFAGNDFVPEAYTEKFYADVNGKGTIKCYVVTGTGGPELIISGNGWDDGEWNDDANTVYANASAKEMFRGFTALKTVSSIDRLDVSGTADMSYMFTDCKALTSIDTSAWNTAGVTNMMQMFYGCTALESVGDLSGWSVSKVSVMSYMFSGCAALKSLNVSGWNTGSVNNMSNMFNGCSSLESLDLSGWKTGGVTTMLSLFQNCGNLQSVGDLSGWDTGKVKSMTSLFYGCAKVQSFGDISGWNTQSATSMANLFYHCTALTELDLSGWSTSGVTAMQNMFNGCGNLSEITVSDKFVTDAVTNDVGMFSGCSALVGGHGTAYGAGPLTSAYARIDTTNAPGYFTARRSR